MRDQPQSSTKKTAGFWLAFIVALSLHVVILLMPGAEQTSNVSEPDLLIDLQISSVDKQLPAPMIKTELLQETMPEPEQVPEPEEEQEQLSENAPEPPETQIESQQIAESTETQRPTMATTPPAQIPRFDFNQMSELEKQQLTSTILYQQYMTETSAIDLLFGKPLNKYEQGPIAEFHYPVKHSMITMLDQPIPDLPFAYQENLIYFAYDPGVQGDLQRFWDVITPEFGWRTKYGTEVKCIWVLVIVACGWK